MGQFICGYCRKSFSGKGTKRKFCSNECSQKSRVIDYRFICETCGKVFTKKIKKARFCSLACFGVSRRTRQKKCKNNCGRSVRRSGRQYCSLKCYHSSAIKRRRVSKAPSGFRPKSNRCVGICYNCGALFAAPQKRKKTCSKRCARELMRKNGGGTCIDSVVNLAVLCANCGREIVKRPTGQSRFHRRSKPQYCSGICETAAKYWGQKLDPSEVDRKEEEYREIIRAKAVLKEVRTFLSTLYS